MAEFKWIWGYIKKYRRLFITAMFLVAVTNVLGLINPFVQGLIVDKVIKGGRTDMLLMLAGTMAGATVVRAIIRYIYLHSFEHISQGIVYDIRESIYKKIQSLDFGFFDSTKTGDIMSRMTGDLEAVRHFTANVIYSVFMHLLSFLLVITILFSMNAVLTLILLVVTPFIAFIAYKQSRIIRPAFAAIREQFSKLNSVVQENISGNRVVKAFAKEDYEIYKFSRENAGFRDVNIEAAKVWEKYLPVLNFLAGTLSVVVILVGGIMVAGERMTLGQLVTFNSFIWAINHPMRMVGWIINDIQRFAASAEKIMFILKKGSRIVSKDDPVVAERLKGYVEFRDVSFGYGRTCVLKGISFKACPGQTTAIVGATGSGKSSLVSLISRFYDCTEGEILIDGVNIKEYDLHSLRKDIAMAMQDIFLFSDTIEGNIAYGVPEVGFEEVKWAAEMAEAHEFISGFSEGYDTIIGERGVGLSGGQRQRIALARALIKNPSIIILDDTTSSVDIETEHLIHRSLGGFYEDKTAFIIAHRISSVKNADQILVLDSGRIAERGTHQELLKLKGRYYDTFINQYGDFDKGEELAEEKDGQE